MTEKQKVKIGRDPEVKENMQIEVPREMQTVDQMP